MIRQPQQSGSACVVVLGMHRSATSVVTRMVNLLGVSLPRAADLGVSRSPNPVNPTGFWEPRLLVDENESMLKAAGGRWHAPPGDTSIRASFASASSTYRQLLISYHRRKPSWVWKDPRLCLLLPDWQSLLGRVLVVIVLRHPLEVADSLRRRDGFDLEHGVALWERYTLGALAAASSLPAAIVQQEDLMAEPLEVAGRLSRWLRSNGLASETNDARIESLVDPSLSGRSRPESVEAAAAPLEVWERVSGLSPDWTEFQWEHSTDMSSTSRQILEAKRKALSVDIGSARGQRLGSRSRLWTYEAIRQAQRLGGRSPRDE